MQFHFTCGHTRGARQLAEFSDSPRTDRQSLNGDTSDLLRHPPQGTRMRLKAGREAPHAQGESWPLRAVYNLQRGREEGPLAGPLLGSVYPRAASAHRRGHPTPREPQDYRGPSAHLPQHSHKTNSGEGATLAFFSGGDAESFSLLQAQALQEQGVAGEARGRQGRRRRSARPERHLSTELTRREGLRGARHTGSRSGGEWGGWGGVRRDSSLPRHTWFPRRAELAPPPRRPRPGRGERRGARRGGWGSLAGDHWPLSPTCPSGSSDAGKVERGTQGALAGVPQDLKEAPGRLC